MSSAKLNPLRLTPPDAARLLSKAGGQPVTEQHIREAIASGAPVDANGNINLVHFGAWLNQQTEDRKQ